MIDTPCAACGKPSEKQYAIHQHAFCDGPEVWICNACGSKPTPALPELWAKIKHRALEGFTLCVCQKEEIE